MIPSSTRTGHAHRTHTWVVLVACEIRTEVQSFWPQALHMPPSMWVGAHLNREIKTLGAC